MRSDHLVSMQEAVLQHGPASDRVYLMKLGGSVVPDIIGFMENLARSNGYTKLFAKIPEHALESFQAHGFRVEAEVPKLYRGHEHGFFMAKYASPKRERMRYSELIDQNLRIARRHDAKGCTRTMPHGWTLRIMTDQDAEAMARLYREVFETYPFPIHDPAYLATTMTSHVRYFGIQDHLGAIAALASAEMDKKAAHAEMTDFATREIHRGKGLAGQLLARMNQDMATKGIRTAFTIARAHSTGMNVVFARAGYTYAGTLTNNTQIKGELESMNVWYKFLDIAN